MCAVSMVSQHYGDQQEWQKPFPWPTTVPNTLPWNNDSYKLLQEIMIKMKEMDEKLGLKDCEDPKKAEWMKSIEDRLTKLGG
jgi:hypothetical protein